ncbi:MAG: ROK family glucokinase [Clostridiales bacterium]|nr:ROK family glucokinase [Clostridiales bacterium]
MMYRVGIDLGGTNIKAGVVDENYRIIADARCKTRLPRPSREILMDMARVAKEAVEKAGLTMDDIHSVGIGIPGTCNADTGVVEYACNVGFENVPVQEEMSALLGRPVYIENDANAAALGEALAGAAKGAQSAVCITLGTGVGGGIIIDGHIYGGFNFAGAELGHIVIMVDGELCGCGRQGCWEAYASATALINQTRQAMINHPDSGLWKIAEDLELVDGRTAFDGMRAGDPVAKQVVDTYIKYIACGLINVINIFQPEVLCIGGGICKEGDTLLLPLKKHIERERYSKYSTHQTRLCVAELGNDAGIIGAAYLG